MKPFLRSVVNTVLLSALIAVLSVSAAAVLLHRQGYRLLSVQTGSMAPMFYAGDAVIVRPVHFNDLRVGDVVSYRNPQSPKVIVSHRVVALDESSQVLTTKGDNVAQSDIPVASHAIEGRVLAHIPALGYILSWLKKLPGLVALVYIPAGIILFRELFILARGLRSSRKYSPAGSR